MTDSATDQGPARDSLSPPRPKKPWKVRTAGRVCLILSLLSTSLYVRDVPRAFDYMITGVLPAKLNILWLEYSLRGYYLPGRFAEKALRCILPAGATGFSVLLLVLGCIVCRATDRVKVHRSEAVIWIAFGAFLLAVDVMTSWIIWKAFVFI